MRPLQMYWSHNGGFRLIYSHSSITRLPPHCQLDKATIPRRNMGLDRQQQGMPIVLLQESAVVLGSLSRIW